jgi:predicted AlkP superfamily pyrophosphatase or phosphodiesterase
MPSVLRVALLFPLAFALSRPAQAGEAPIRPARAADPPIRLVLVIAIDQLRPDRLDESLPGGLGRLVREGRFFVDAALDHGMTETCPGHATMLTGHHPAAAGIPANDFFDPDTGAEIYCAGDARPEAAELGAESGVGFSPARLRVTALGDWLKAASPESRVFTVSGKDRGAIMMGGQHPDGAFWYKPGPIPRFTTSRWYRAELPGWVAAFNGADPPRDGFLAALPERWEHAPIASPKTPDDQPGEATRFSRTSPHPLRDADLAKLGDNLFFTPFLDLATLDFARRLVEEEELGTRASVDVLGVSLSANDSVGHLYGPWSQESADHLARVDVALGGLLDFLEARTGGGLLVALTADHGVLPLPEWEIEQGVSKCRVEGGRAGIRGLALSVFGRLWWNLGPWFAWLPRWLQFANSQIRIDRALLAEREIPLEQAVAEAEAALEKQPAIARAWTAAEIASEPGPLAELYRHSFVHGRSGDLVVQVAEGCLISDFDTGTTHGTPYLYDRSVPVLFRGPGVEPGRVRGRAATVDIAPTLAARIGLATPADLDGRPLPLVGPDRRLARDASPLPPTDRR